MPLWTSGGKCLGDGRTAKGCGVTKEGLEVYLNIRCQDQNGETGLRTRAEAHVSSLSNSIYLVPANICTLSGRNSGDWAWAHGQKRVSPKYNTKYNLRVANSSWSSRQLSSNSIYLVPSHSITSSLSLISFSSQWLKNLSTVTFCAIVG